MHGPISKFTSWMLCFCVTVLLFLSSFVFWTREFITVNTDETNWIKKVLFANAKGLNGTERRMFNGLCASVIWIIKQRRQCNDRYVFLNLSKCQLLPIFSVLGTAKKKQQQNFFSFAANWTIHFTLLHTFSVQRFNLLLFYFFFIVRFFSDEQEQVNIWFCLCERT